MQQSRPEVQANLQEMNQALQFSKDQILTVPYREHLNQGSNESEDMHLDISKMNEHDYQNLKEVRFLEYENLNSLKDYTNKESKAQIKDYLGSKDYEGTNQTFWSKPVIRMYGLPALQTIGGTASIVGSALVSETGIGLPLGIYLAGTGADDVQTGVSNFGREPANQRVSTREQALQNIGLSEKNAAYTALALDLGSIGASATKIGANSIRSYNDAQKTIYTNLTDANVPIQYEATVAKDVKSTPNTTPIKEKPKEMALEDYGRDFAIFNGEKVTPQFFEELYHGTNAKVLGLPETSTINEMMTHVFNNGLPARKKDIDLGKHQNSNPETAFRGTTIEPVSQIGNAGAAHWAKDGGIVIHIKDQKGYDLNELHATSNTGGGIGGMVNQAVYSGEFEIAIPAYVKPEDIARIGYVDETGRFPQVIFTPREDFLKQVEKNVKK